jgi:hypothetical protein
MRIKVLVKEIDEVQPQKMDEEEPLEVRHEYGFQIQISYMKNQFCDANNKIKQLRWSRGYLSPMK